MVEPSADSDCDSFTEALLATDSEEETEGESIVTESVEEGLINNEGTDPAVNQPPDPNLAEEENEGEPGNAEEGSVNDAPAADLLADEIDEQPEAIDPLLHPLLKRRIISDTCYKSIMIGTIFAAHVSSSGIWTFSVKYASEGPLAEKIITHDQALISLLPIINSTNPLHSTKYWKLLKTRYAILSKAVRDNVCNPMDDDLIRSMFGFKDTTDINKKSLKRRFNELQRDALHPDKCINEPPQVKFVAASLNLGLRFLLETRVAILEGIPSCFSAPTTANCPMYGSDDFCSAARMDFTNITQPTDGQGLGQVPPSQPPAQAPSPTQPAQAPNPAPTPNPSPTTTGGGLVPTTPPFDPHGLDSPDDPYPSFDNDSTECVLGFHLDDFFVNNFYQPTFVPAAASEDWAIVFCTITTSLNSAISNTGPEQRRMLATAIRWYAGMPQIFLRGTGKDSTKNSTAIRKRLASFIKGDFSDLIKHWRIDIDKREAKNKAPKPDTEARRAEYGISLIRKGRISRGVSIIQGHGRACISDPVVRQQMMDKHPQVDTQLTLADRHKHSDQPFGTGFLLDGVEGVDVLVGVGPRGFKGGYIRPLVTSRFTQPKAKDAYQSFYILGQHYVNGTMPPWMNRKLGAGLLTPLNKKAVVEGEEIDARPTKAEDIDTALWCKALQRSTAEALRDQLAPQQLGVGVKSGVETLVLGLAMSRDIACSKGENHVILALDMKNAHNEFSRSAAQAALEEAADQCPALGALPKAHKAINGVQSDIFAREASGKLSFITKSCTGGGQGNPTTNGFFPITIDSTVKRATQHYPGIGVHCLQDDITIDGDNLAEVLAASELILEELATRGLKPNKSKFQLYGNYEDAVSEAPDWLTRPSVTLEDGTEAHGIIICGAAIGDDGFVRAYLDDKHDELCGSTAEDGSHIQGSLEKLILPMAEVDPHSASCVMFYSGQCRIDYLLATHLPSQTRKLAQGMDLCLRRLYEVVNGIDLLDESGHTAYTTDPTFTADRFRLSTKYGGSGYRVTENRANFANAMNNCAPLMAEFFPSLVSVLGENSFDQDNDATRWSVFFNSSSTFATELESEFLRLKSMYMDACQSAGLNPAPPCILTEEVVSFGGGGIKLQKTASDLTGNVKAKDIELRALQQSQSDHRRKTYLGGGMDQFSHTIHQGHPHQEVLFSPKEFQIAVQCAHGVPIPLLSHLVGRKIADNNTARFDRYGENLKTAVGFGGPTALHNGLQSHVIMDLRKAGIANSTGKDVFSHVVNDTSTHSAADDRWRQGILPDAVVDGKNLPASYLGAGMARFGGVASLIDFKTVAPGTRYEQNLPAGRSPFGAVVEQRQSDVNRDYHQTAKKMDAARGTPPDTIGPIELEMNTYGHEGDVIGPVLGAYGEFSKHAYELADLIVTKRAHDFCELNNMGRKQAKSMFTQVGIVCSSRMGHLASTT